MWLRHLIQNHVLTNLFFALVLVVGTLTYMKLPRQQDPTINFNWVQIMTFLPGASAKEIEQQVTDRIEEAIEKIQDIKFVSSTSRESVSSILVRFRDISEREFDKRIADLRREITSIEDELPEETERPEIFEVTTANAYPTATVVMTGLADDENLRKQARALEKDLARIAGVDQVQPTGLLDPELQLLFDREKLELLQLSPVTLADQIRALYQDTSLGATRVSDEQWLMSFEGTTVDPEALAQMMIPIPGGGRITLGEVAEVIWTRADPDRLVRYEGKPAVLFALTKQPKANTLELVGRIEAFIEARNQYSAERGVVFTLADDQTQVTRSALAVMQKNALYGLVLVLLATWFFLGSKISLLVTIGIPFTLAGTFIALYLMGQTLNTSVLLAIVIALGMLVDDAVVVVESIYYRIKRGASGINASWGGLLDVIKPVTASVLTTIAAFLPLMLLPGILGKFMLVIPLVVTTALLISLVEAYWMLPGHVMAAKVSMSQPTTMDLRRERVIRKVRHIYGLALVKVMRHPRLSLLGLALIFSIGPLLILQGTIKYDFFASDSLRLFYVNVTMPSSARLEETMAVTLEAEEMVQRVLSPGDARSVVSYAGQAFSDMAPLFGDYLGQVLVSLNPQSGDMRSVEQITAEIEPLLKQILPAKEVSILKLAGGPPVSKAISVKVRGDSFDEIRAAADALKAFMVEDDRYVQTTDDDSPGRNGLIVTLNHPAIAQAGVNPVDVIRLLRMLVDGEIVSATQHEGDTVVVRVRSQQTVEGTIQDAAKLFDITLPTAGGGHIALSELVHYEVKQVKGNIRHYNFMRTITLESDINKALIDTVQANQLLVDHWADIGAQFPNVTLDFTGELDDIKESIDAMGYLFLLGIGLMYLILSTQFQSYFQPLMILITVPLAFTGVILGLLVTNNPLSLYTLYGVVALAGISVNAAIVLISTANRNLLSGFSLGRAIFFAARRRMLPILITTLTTVAGLFSLATGLGGQSLLWSPVAISIVSGLLFSSLLTLFAIPTLYMLSMPKRRAEAPASL